MVISTSMTLGKKRTTTPPKTKRAPEKWWLGNDILFGARLIAVRFREGTSCCLVTKKDLFQQKKKHKEKHHKLAPASPSPPIDNSPHLLLQNLEKADFSLLLAFYELTSLSVF